MLVTKIETIEKGKVNKYKVFIDDEYEFLLYPKEIHRYHIKENDCLTEQIYNEIYFETVLRRGKQKALAILKHMDRTEFELAQKLKLGEYSDKVITEVLNYVKSYHYIDDMRYTINYIRSNKSRKSKRQLQTTLYHKGIDKNTIEKALDEEYDIEDYAIKKAIDKKGKNLEFMTKEDKLKLASSLYRKGFEMDLIKKYVYTDYADI